MSRFENRIQNTDGILVLIGAYDALSARLIAQADCEAVYCSGFSVTASQHGLPDLGLLGLAEMHEIYQRVSKSIGGKPLIVDGDAGHGGLLNVERTIEAFQHLGVDAMHLEDQVLPKRCGHLGGKDVLPRNEAIARVLTAVKAAGKTGPSIIARTDAIAVHGFDDAIDRSNAFLDAGASCIFIDAPTDYAQIEAIPQRIKGPVLFNAAPTGVGPEFTTAQFQDFGYACVIHPIELILASMGAVRDEIRALRGHSGIGSQVNFAEINEVLGTNHFIERELKLTQ